MSGATNAALRAPLTRDPTSVVDVYSADDLPDAITAPDGVSRRPLVQGTLYIIHKTFVWPRLLIPPATSLTDFTVSSITSANTNVNLLFAGDATPHIWGRGIGPFAILSMQFVDISNAGAGRGTKLFDLVGGTFVSFVALDFCTFFNFKEMGNLVDIAFQIDGILVQGAGSGFVSRINSGQDLSHVIRALRMKQLPTHPAMDKPTLCLLGAPTDVAVQSSAINLNSGDAAIYLDAAATGAYVITGNVFQGTGNGDFLRQDVAASLTAMVNVDQAIASFSDSAAAPGVDTTVNFASQPGLVRGQVVLIADEAAYDGTHTIVRVAADEMSFDINVVHSTSGAGTLKVTRVTSAGHPLVRDETNTIAGTTSYNGTTNLLGVTDDTFDIPVAFVADDATGTVSSASRDQTSVGVDITNNGAQANSKSIGCFFVNDNTTATTIASADVWQAIDVTGAVPAANLERWTLTTAATGLLTYDDLRPFSGTLLASITANKTGSNEQYDFGISINGADPAGVFVPLDIKTTLDTVLLLSAVGIVSGDTVQLMVRAKGTTNAPTIRHASLAVE